MPNHVGLYAVFFSHFSYQEGIAKSSAQMILRYSFQTEGSRQVQRETNHYNLQMVIAVGFKVNDERAVQFRN